MKVYIVGSLENPVIPEATNALIAAGFDVFSDWFAAGPGADYAWADYEKKRGRSYRDALTSPAAQNVFRFDLRNLLAANVVVQVMPSGKSAAWEMGFAAGRGKPTFILMDEPGKKTKWDVMALFAGEPINDEEVRDNPDFFRTPGVAYNIEELISMIHTYMARLMIGDREVETA